LNKHHQSFFQSKTKFAISLTYLTGGERRLFYKLPPGEVLPVTANTGWMQNAWRQIQGLEMLVQGLMGSTALPVLFPPFEGLFDGGVLLNQPISPAIALGAANLYVVIPSSAALGRTNNLLAIGNTLLTTWLSLSILSQLNSIRLRNEIRAKVGDQKIRVCVIRPPVSLESALDVNLLSFGKRVSEMIEPGEKAARDRLDRFDSDNENTWY
jgi:predicted acylesterase/phospholipase RssA